jgi:Domain of unknown function (DUF1963)
VFESLSDLQTAFDDIGLTELGQDLVRLSKVGLRVDYSKGGPHQLGGVPNLPALTPWPTSPTLLGARRYTSGLTPELSVAADDQPLTFVADLDLTRIAGLVPESPLPTTGRLLFFWDDVYYESPDTCQVLYLENPGRTTASTGEGCWPSLQFDLVPGITVPDREIVEGLSEHVPEYTEECEYVYLSECRISTWTKADDRVLGWAATVQEEPFLRIGQIDEKERDHSDWTLLLQIELGHASGATYPSGSVLYFIAPTEDVIAGRFDRVVADYQQS